MIIDDTGRVHAHTLILNASCISVNVRSVRQSTQRLQGNNTNLTNLPPIEKPRQMRGQLNLRRRRMGGAALY